MSEIKTTYNGFEIDIEDELSLMEMSLHDSFEFKFHGEYIMKVIKVPDGLMYVHARDGRFVVVKF